MLESERRFIMYILLLAVIYIAFIGLGLPDSLIGSAWPVMHLELGVEISSMGIVTMIISAGTIISSLMSDFLTKKLGAGMITAISVTMTAASLVGFSLSQSFVLLCFLAVPYGIGAGAVDSALNNYVALHYSSRHMSWLHCFWGVGAATGPYIMGYCIGAAKGWSSGYFYVSVIQLVISAILFASLPLWKKRVSSSDSGSSGGGIFSSLKIKGVPLVLITFFAYCALESTAGLWSASYFADGGISSESAARFASFFYIGITVGRFISGFVADKLGDRRFVRIGLCVIFIGIGMLMAGSFLSLVGLIVIGLGCAPIYPCIIHATPTNFGAENSQAIIGIQMASAYLGTTLMPPVFGFLTRVFGMRFLPFYLLVFAFLMLFASERLNALKSSEQRVNLQK